MITQYKVVTSPKEPEIKNVLWLKDNKLYYYNGGWEQLYKDFSTGGGPTKLSLLKNDVGFITSKDIPKYDLTRYYTKEEINTNYQPKGDYALKSEVGSIPTKVSELDNDSNYIHTVNNKQSTDGTVTINGEDINVPFYAVNDSGEYEFHEFTVSELATNLVDSLTTLSLYLKDAFDNKANASDIPTKVSQLDNDSKFATMDEVNRAILNAIIETLNTEV